MVGSYHHVEEIIQIQYITQPYHQIAVRYQSTPCHVTCPLRNSFFCSNLCWFSNQSQMVLLLLRAKRARIYSNRDLIWIWTFLNGWIWKCILKSLLLIAVFHQIKSLLLIFHHLRSRVFISLWPILYICIRMISSHVPFTPYPSHSQMSLLLLIDLHLRI